MPSSTARTRAHQKAKQADKPDFVMELDGTPYPIRMSEITGLDSAAFRRATGGLSLIGTIRAIAKNGANGADLDIVAALAWISRRQHGEPTLDFEEVAEAIGYESSFDLLDGDEGAEAAAEVPDPNS